MRSAKFKSSSFQKVSNKHTDEIMDDLKAIINIKGLKVTTCKYLENKIASGLFDYANTDNDALLDIINSPLYAGNPKRDTEPFNDSSFQVEPTHRLINVCLINAINASLEGYFFRTVHEYLTATNKNAAHKLSYEAYRLISQGGMLMPAGIPIAKINIFGEDRYIALKLLRREDAKTICKWERDPILILQTLMALGSNRLIAEIEYIQPKAKSSFVNHAITANYRNEKGWCLQSPDEEEFQVGDQAKTTNLLQDAIGIHWYAWFITKYRTQDEWRFASKINESNDQLQEAGIPANLMGAKK